MANKGERRKEAVQGTAPGRWMEGQAQGGEPVRASPSPAALRDTGGPAGSSGVCPLQGTQHHSAAPQTSMLHGSL